MYFKMEEYHDKRLSGKGNIQRRCLLYTVYTPIKMSFKFHMKSTRKKDQGEIPHISTTASLGVGKHSFIISPLYVSLFSNPLEQRCPIG